LHTDVSEAEVRVTHPALGAVLHSGIAVVGLLTRGEACGDAVRPRELVAEHPGRRAVEVTSVSVVVAALEDGPSSGERRSAGEGPSAGLEREDIRLTVQASSGVSAANSPGLASSTHHREEEKEWEGEEGVEHV